VEYGGLGAFGGSGVLPYSRLRGLSPGTEILYDTAEGTKVFVITAVQIYGPGVDVAAVAASSDMTLITCGGQWDAAAHEYSERTFVFANFRG
jgi:hypothetical protein